MTLILTFHLGHLLYTSPGWEGTEVLALAFHSLPSGLREAGRGLRGLSWEVILIEEGGFPSAPEALVGDGVAGVWRPGLTTPSVFAA